MTDTHVLQQAAEFDPELTRRIGQDRGALEAFYRARYEALMRYFTSRVGDPHDVADLVADTFMSAITSAGSYDPRRGRPIAWLYGIAHNVHRRSHRTRASDLRVVGKVAGRRLLDGDDIARIEDQIDAARQVNGVGLFDRLSAAERELNDDNVDDINRALRDAGARAKVIKPGPAGSCPAHRIGSRLGRLETVHRIDDDAERLATGVFVIPRQAPDTTLLLVRMRPGRTSDETGPIVMIGLGTQVVRGPAPPCVEHSP